MHDNYFQNAELLKGHRYYSAELLRDQQTQKEQIVSQIWCYRYMVLHRSEGEKSGVQAIIHCETLKSYLVAYQVIE